MQPLSVGRFPSGWFLILLASGIVSAGFSQSNHSRTSGNSAVPVCQSACENQPPALASEQLEYMGIYASDGKFRTRRTAHNSVSAADPRHGWSRPSEVPDFINLHSRERVEANSEPPAHAAQAVKGQSVLASMRDNIVRLAYGREPVLLAPHHVTVDSRGRILIVDPVAHSVHVLGNGEDFRISGGLQRRLQSPNGIAVDATDRIYVADSERGLVLVYDSDGKFVRYIGRRGKETLFHNPTAIAIDRTTGRLFLLDSPRNLMFVLDLEGNVLKRIGRRSVHAIGKFSGDTVPMDLDYPTEIAIGNNQVVVVDSSNSRIQVMDLECQLLTQFRIPAGRPIVDEVGLSVDATGKIYVSNTRDSRIRVYSPDGTLLASFGRAGTNIGEFSSPAGMWIDESSRLYVADTNNDRVQVFQLSHEPDNAAIPEGTR